MPLQTVLTQRLELNHPIIQAPLAGGGDTPDLVATVCEAGALGFIGAAYLTPLRSSKLRGPCGNGRPGHSALTSSHPYPRPRR